MVEKAVYAILQASTAIVVAVDQRTYPVIAPAFRPPMRPHIVFARLPGTDRKYTLGGSEHLPSALIRLNCWALKYDVARDLATAVIAAFDFKNGTFGGVEVHQSFIDDEFDGKPEFLAEGQEMPAFNCVVDVRMVYRES